MSTQHRSPTGRLRLAFYGDDFTGSTDALEVLAFAGLRCALFLAPPSAEALEKLGGLDAIGIAGDSRAMSPGEMREALPPMLASLAALGPPVVHYKVCSTFDSAPSIGSIGQVMDLSRAVFGDTWIPIVGGTPALSRYCVFGNLFARSGTDGQTYRIDRHPIMSMHPVTPMHEGDLALHLGMQTRMSIEKFSVPQLAGTSATLDERIEGLIQKQPGAILFDSLTADHLTQVGRLLEVHTSRNSPAFVVGSSGVEYALTQWWGATAQIDAPEPEALRHFDGIEQVLAVSGSASALSALQIDAAVLDGFAELPIDASALVDDARWQTASDALVGQAVALLHEGRSVVMHTTRGPADPRIEALIASLMERGQSRDEARHAGGRLLGVRLGLVVDAILRTAPLRRLILSGGDTSSQVTRVLAPDALVIEARLAPGAPLCRAISDQPHLSSLQIALKGGQMGDASYFIKALRGSTWQPA